MFMYQTWKLCCVCDGQHVCLRRISCDSVLLLVILSLALSPAWVELIMGSCFGPHTCGSSSHLRLIISVFLLLIKTMKWCYSSLDCCTISVSVAPALNYSSFSFVSCIWTNLYSLWKQASWTCHLLTQGIESELECGLQIGVCGWRGVSVTYPFPPWISWSPQPQHCCTYHSFLCFQRFWVLQLSPPVYSVGVWRLKWRMFDGVY